MALQVITNPQTGTISGVQTAPSNLPQINGVVQASGGTIGGVSSSPSSSATNYNPQGLAQANPQPAAGVKTIMPNTTTAQAINQTPTASSQTYKLGDGSVYNSSGQQVSGPTSTTGTSATGYSSTPSGATVASGPTTLNTPTPNTSQPSTSLTGDNSNTSYGDIQTLLNQNLTNMNQLFSNLSQYSTVGSAEQAQQQKVASDQAAMTGLGYQAQGLYNPDNQSIALPFLTGQAQNKLVGAGIQSTLDQSVLNYMQGNRQFAFNSASTIFNASQQNLETALDAYTKTAPQNLSTNYNPTTGAVNAIMRNPLTGETYTASLGNIGAQKSFTSTNIQTDPLTGALTFVGTTSDGQIITQPISGNGSGGASITNPLQGSSGSGNYTQTSQPSAATSTVGGLLSNWTSGGTTQPGAGYQNAVYQTVSQLTGQKIDANTPTSTLVSNIPALSQGIAKAEGYGQANNVGTRINNPGNILWANQPNATAYTASNGYTYAKFNTEQDGWNAMNDLVAKKLGAVPTPTPQTQQQAIQSAPPAIQSAIRNLQDGTPFIDGSQLTAAQIPMAQSFASQHSIPYVNSTDADKLNEISVTQNNLQDFSKLVNSGATSGGFLSRLSNTISGRLNASFGGSLMQNYDSFRTVALNSIQSLAGGTGSGLRLSQGEINQAIDNLPRYNDPTGVANTKLQVLTGLLNKWTSQILPNWNPAEAAATQQANLILQGNGLQ